MHVIEYCDQNNKGNVSTSQANSFDLCAQLTVNQNKLTSKVSTNLDFKQLVLKTS